MRKAIFVVAICLLASMALAAAGTVQPLNVKTGLWEVTTTSVTNGAPPISPDMQAKLDQLPPEQRAKVEEMIKNKFSGTPTTASYKKCVTKEDLNKNPLGKPDDRCPWTVVTSTGTDMEIRTSSCPLENGGVKGDVNLKFHVVDSENVTASMQATAAGNGQTAKFGGTYKGKWLGATCPDGTN